MNRRPRQPGIALLEVVLALSLFVVGSGILSLSLRSVMQTNWRMDLQAQAANLATTRMSEIQMNPFGLAEEGPTPYEEPLEDWTWQVLASPLEEAPEMRRVEVIVTHAPSGIAERQVQWLAIPEPAEETIDDLFEADEASGMDAGGLPPGGGA